MAQIIGQCYNAELTLKDMDGKHIKFDSSNWEEKLEVAHKVRFQVSVGSRKAFADEDNKLVFTKAITYQKGLAKVLYKNFGQSEHHGKWVCFNGHFDEFEWKPDITNKDHKHLLQKETLTRADLEAVGFKFAEGSPEKVTFYVAPKQTSRQLVVNGFEFIGANESRSDSTIKTGTKTSTGSTIMVAGESADDDEEVSAEKSANTPF